MLCLNVSAACAHAGLVSSSPKSGELLSETPGQITLRFSETLEPDLVTIKLYDWNANEIALPKPQLQAGDAVQVNVPLHPLPEGTYTVVWSVVSEDGHPVDDSFLFSVGQESAAVKKPTEHQDTSGSGDLPLILLRYLVEGLILLGGGLYFVGRCARRYGLPAFSQTLGKEEKGISWLLLLVGTVCLWFGYAETLNGVSLTSALLEGRWELLAQSPFAMMLLAIFLLLILLAIPHMVEGWYAAIWVLLVGVLAAGGHVWGIHPVWLSLALRILHVLSISLWLGALFYLVLISRRTDVNQSGFKAMFLRIVAVSAILSVLSGICMVMTQTEVSLLLQTVQTWSVLFANKLVLVAVMLIAAWRQTRRWGKGSPLSQPLLYGEWLAGIIVILLGVWMSQTNYPVFANM